jgi:hypothetical protein
MAAERSMNVGGDTCGILNHIPSIFSPQAVEMLKDPASPLSQRKSNWRLSWSLSKYGNRYAVAVKCKDMNSPAWVLGS